MKSILKLLILLIILSSCSSVNKFTDVRDGKKYKIVKIGKQTWMAENLNYTLTSGSWCINDSAKYCLKYGRLYDWETAKKACLAGWHLPTDIEWNNLVDYLGGSKLAGGKLKSTKGWNKPNTGATNTSRFSALPGGYRNSLKRCYNLGNFGNWWSASEKDDKTAWNFTLLYNSSASSDSETSSEIAFSVRCLRN